MSAFITIILKFYGKTLSSIPHLGEDFVKVPPVTGKNTRRKKRAPARTLFLSDDLTPELRTDGNKPERYTE